MYKLCAPKSFVVKITLSRQFCLIYAFALKMYNRESISFNDAAIVPCVRIVSGALSFMRRADASVFFAVLFH